jgi:SPP1 family predicted phage head-tail adaptor
VRAGNLDRRIELRHRRVVRDEASGQAVEKWTTAYATVWAQKDDQRGREYFAAQQITGELTTAFRVRFRPDVKMTDRVVYDDLSYNVHAIIEIGRREGLFLMASATRT